MRPFFVWLFVLIFVTPAYAAPKKKKTPCQPDLSSCPDQGCGKSFDPLLNERKNVTSVPGPGRVLTLTDIKDLPDPENFAEGDARDDLEAKGEGQLVTALAYLLAAKSELGGESCNCGLQTPEWTDNHLVLVSKWTVDKFRIGSSYTAKEAFAAREEESVTAEFTPRVRLSHPHFTKATMDPFINKAKQKALLVRVTGQLMFDSEHFLHNALVRVNNWEIHPVFKMEYCTTTTPCKVDSDTGWASVDDLP